MCPQLFTAPPASLSRSNLGLSELVESVPPAQQVPGPLLDPLAPEPHSSHPGRKAAEADACHLQVLTLPSGLWVPQPFIRSREGGVWGWRSERDSGLGGLPVTKSLQHQVGEEGEEQGLFEPDLGSHEASVSVSAFSWGPGRLHPPCPLPLVPGDSVLSYW